MRRQLRSCKDPEGRIWSLFLRAEERYEPGALLVFTGDPKDGMGSPKILVRGLRDWEAAGNPPPGEPSLAVGIVGSGVGGDGSTVYDA